MRNGRNMRRIIDSGKTYSLGQTLQVMRDLLSALEYAHRQNVVHRDVKPANMLVEANGRVKLTDFGVARIQDSGEATRTRVLDGSGSYSGFPTTEPMNEETLLVERSSGVGHVLPYRGVPGTGDADACFASPKGEVDSMSATAKPAMEPATAAKSAAPAVAATTAASKVKPAGEKSADAPLAAVATAPASTGATPVRAAAEVAPSAPAAAKSAVAKGADAATQASSLAAGNPEKGCEGRILLGFQICMNAQCEKAEFFAHPTCKQRRMAEQARAVQQNSRN